MTKKSAKKSAVKKKAVPNAEIAAAMRQMEKLMASGDLITQDDLNALMASLRGPSAQDGLTDAEADARYEAQQLAFDAMEAESEAQALKLARRALAKDSDCVDALVVLAGIETDSPRKMIEALEKAVAAGERSLGDSFIQENKGDFWGLIETRPYMRALEQLASLQRAEGLNLDAIKNYEKILRLNPNDNQGVRDPLLGLYLAVCGLDEAGKLLRTYEGDCSANMAWCRVLERFLSHDLAGAAVALAIAREANRYVELYLTGQRKTPKSYPEMYSLGSEEEAILCLDYMALAWGNSKSALLWLMEQLIKDMPEVAPAKLTTGSASPRKKHR